jgi:hypothetical protein
MTAIRNAARLLTAVVLAGCVSGCFVFEEIDKAMALDNGPGVAQTGEKPGPKKRTADGGSERASAAASKPASGDAAKKGAVASVAETAKNWWATATTLSSEESTEEIVACNVYGKIEFREKEDCISRGGSLQ